MRDDFNNYGCGPAGQKASQFHLTPIFMEVQSTWCIFVNELFADHLIEFDSSANTNLAGRQTHPNVEPTWS
jgi:hypothetical protein